MKKKNNAMKYLHFTVILMLILALLGFRNDRIITGILLAGIGGTLLLMIAPRLPRIKFRPAHVKTRGRRKAWKAEISANRKPDIHAALLCQVSHRITEKLKSAFPDAVWDWTKRPDATALLDGETVRISTANTRDYNHAELKIDAYGNISLKMMLVKPLEETGTRKKKPEPAPETPGQEGQEETPVVDCRSWYELVGEKALAETITELNAHGHSQLSINGNGDILIRENKKMVPKSTLPHFPGKDYYRELIPIFEAAELKASVSNGNLKLSWV